MVVAEEYWTGRCLLGVDDASLVEHPEPAIQSFQDFHDRTGIAGAFRLRQQLQRMQLELHRIVLGHLPAVLEAQDLFHAQIRVQSADMGRIGRYLIAPDVIIEAKKLRTSLDQWVHKLHDYAAVAPRMSSGIGVLTNGGHWWIYNLALRDEFPKKLVGRIDVLDDEPPAAAHVLDHWLGRLGIG